MAGKSRFPIYRELGVGIYQMDLGWHQVASTRPLRPTDPADRAYRWPTLIDRAIREGRSYGISVSVTLRGGPAWANGGRASHWAPRDPRDFARFATAAARRYPRVHHWMIWGEPSKPKNFQPLAQATQPGPLSRRQTEGPRLYARILDAAYAALKEVNRRNLVIGGNTWTCGYVPPLNFIRAMRLPSGQPPRMDLYGHNPFTTRKPDLRKAPLRYGCADFSDLDTLTGWLDRYLHRGESAKLRLFLSELVVPTDHANHEVGFHVSRRTQARWLAAALHIARRWRRIYTLGWLGLYDDPPRPGGDEVNRGLIDRQGRRKPSYGAYRRG